MAGKRKSTRGLAIACDADIYIDESPKEVSANPAHVQTPVEYNYFESAELKHGDCIELSIHHDYTIDDVFITWFCEKTNDKITNCSTRNSNKDLFNFKMEIRDDKDYGKYFCKLHSNSNSKIIFTSKKISITKPKLTSNKYATNSRGSQHNNLQAPQQMSRKDPEQGMHQNQITNIKPSQQHHSRHPLQSEINSQAYHNCNYNYHQHNLPPIIIMNPKGGCYKTGTDVQLQSKFENASMYQWFRNDSPLAGCVGEQLNINGVKRLNEGIFQVIAYNINGQTSSIPTMVTVFD